MIVTIIYIYIYIPKIFQTLIDYDGIYSESFWATGLLSTPPKGFEDAFVLEVL